MSSDLLSGIIDIERVCNLVRKSFTGAKAGFADSNVNLIKAGGDFIKNGLWEGSDGQENINYLLQIPVRHLRDWLTTKMIEKYLL